MSNSILFDLTYEIDENAPVSVKFVWDALYNATGVSLLADDYENLDAEPNIVVSDKKNVVDYFRDERQIWTFDVGNNPPHNNFQDNHKLIAWDLDGTICNLDHREHFLQGKKRNWPAFNAGILHDTPNSPVTFLFRLLSARTDVTSIIVTARDGSLREVSENWLKKYGLTNYERMYIREKGSFRKDSEEKSLLMKQIVADYGKKPDIIWDDRPSVTREFREKHALFVWNCNQRNREF